ncbi:MAG: hypothetical protein HDS95_07990 [Bacteroidales bacterium]|nr:hypothetical protein [Bacteroidales bacterium]
MTQRFIPLLLTVISAVSCFAEKTNIQLDPLPKKDPELKSPRAPMRLPIDVVFDNETMTIQVSCVSNLEGEVFLYNASNELEDYSPCLNAILTLSNSNYHTILIEGDGWSATGVIE